MKKSFQEFQQAIELDAEHEDAHYGLGVVYMELGKLKKAVEEFKRILIINQESHKAKKALRMILKPKDTAD